MSDPTNPVTLPQDWYIYVVNDGVNVDQPGLYEWAIEGVGTYIGKYKRIRRPTKEYARNVVRLLNNKPYRLGNANGFRRIHRELERAHREGRKIRLTILENAALCDLSSRERQLIAARGMLNDPAFGVRKPK